MTSEIYSVSEIESIPAVIGDFTFFAAEKWRIASGKSGSGNTANMGSIQFIDDIINGNGVFAKAGEELFNDYWANFGRIKIQGIKTKLISVIRQNVSLKKNILWIEPFMGSGVVGFNIRPERAIFADINPHIINFYKAVKAGKITSDTVRAFLYDYGRKLEAYGGDFYHSVRSSFNRDHNPLEFLFLNRSCFNGMIRFNKDYCFNVPYNHKPGRFSKAYITKIANQVQYIEVCLKIYD